MTSAAANTSTSNDQFRQKAREIKDNIVDLAGIAKDAARDTFSDLKDGAASRYQSGVQKVGQAREGIIDYLKENPAKALLACACVGALAGFLMSRRR
jgi:ElaB/YqjD/DUF883 family membrane-anchored ribosome-binding protein